MIHLKPMEIESRSLEIITEELHEKKIELKSCEEAVIKRVIHTSADFDYAKNLCFSEGAVEIALNALRKGCDIVTDTEMAKSGINKTILASLGGSAHCFMGDEKVAAIAKERETTRAVVSMEVARNLPKPCIFAIGNAPTALLRLEELIREEGYQPVLIIGVPVGFVNVIEAKELIMTTNVPYIVARGRKGGSNVAAAICNALLYQIKR
ncbi:precorrin-8X methylmutase [Lachnoclostridium phytofermentans]|jgi:precorrin-8X/cobalt-precorrin-8 methylmutase|uniref:precorrin-8X methylmutase n=1 Tax=Lachnoclostridium phytofermentans TaxID=66219 RepID=UPI0004962A68|nr:precorrin-8X methylmutase [Lachnoclostridium phytofermentans]